MRSKDDLGRLWKRKRLVIFKKYLEEILKIKILRIIIKKVVMNHYLYFFYQIIILLFIFIHYFQILSKI